MNNVIKKTVVASLITAISFGALANDHAKKLHDWQMKTIYQPSVATLEREQAGFVNIYDGFTSAEVDQILDDKYARIENMMFTRVKLTDTNGDLMIDPYTGEELVEDDGCD